MSDTPIPLRSARQHLALIWFIGAVPLFLFVLVLSLTAPQQGTEVWSWFLPTVMPNLSLIVGVWVSESRAGGAEDGSADSFMYRITAGLSVFYLLIIAGLFLLHPYYEHGLGAWLKASQPWLATLQGLVSLAMGAFYVRRSA